MNKGKYHDAVDGYLCNRCGVIISASSWRKDTHKKCNHFLKGKEKREFAMQGALNSLNKHFN